MWDTSNANKLGRLCQGIGSGPAPTGQRVAGTNTFYIIVTRTSHPTSARKSATPWSFVRFLLKRMILTAPVSPLAATGFTIRAMLAPTQPRLNSSSSYSTLSSTGKELGSAPSISRTSIWTLLCLIPYMFASNSLTSRTSISRSTISQAETKMAGSTLKFAKAVMDFPKLASLPITFSDCALLLRASTKLLPHQDFGSTNGVHSSSASLWVTLVSNTLALNTSTFFWSYLKKSMVCSVTWPETNLPALPSNWTILANAAASACPGTLTICS